jgi:hypothetical protein
MHSESINGYLGEASLKATMTNKQTTNYEERSTKILPASENVSHRAKEKNRFRASNVIESRVEY